MSCTDMRFSEQQEVLFPLSSVLLLLLCSRCTTNVIPNYVLQVTYECNQHTCSVGTVPHIHSPALFMRTHDFKQDQFV